MERGAMRIARGLAVLAAGLLIASTKPLLAQGSTPLKWKVPDSVKTVEVNGYPMAYHEAGTGTPVILIHGAWVDFRLFAPQVEALAKTNRAIAVSIRHHFPEPWDGKGGAYTVQQQAADVVAFIKALGLGKVHLLGHSRGGGVAFNAAVQAPDAIRTLILEEPSGLETLVDASTAERSVGNWAKLAGFVRAKLDEGDPRVAAQKSWNVVFGPGKFEAMPAGVQQMIADNLGTMSVPYTMAQLTCDDVRKLSFPMLILQGETSPASYRAMSKALQACKPDIPDPVIVPKAGHNMHVDNASFFNQKVLQFVQSH
jgi:pimeloyl-ACP methyl ester carboxylesterase